MNKRTKWGWLSPVYTVLVLGLALYVMTLLGSCQAVSLPESAQQGRLVIQYPSGDFDDGSRWMGLPPPPDCSKYAHNAPKPDHNKWADCMGVGYN